MKEQPGSNKYKVRGMECDARRKAALVFWVLNVLCLLVVVWK
jgi:hypothetical protein